ncbi:MAG: hypothetical protein ACE5E1_05120 [Phycisphaerae bacterium]
MFTAKLFSFTRTLLVLLAVGLLWPSAAAALPAQQETVVSTASLDGTPSTGKKKRKKKKKKKKRKSRKKGKRRKKRIIRWGQRRNESNEKYDKRLRRVLAKIKQDKKGDFAGGMITNGEEQIRMWTYMGHPFIVRTDIDKEFTADTVMYMEMLHREYSAAYKKFLGVKADLKEPIEVIVFADRATYMKNGGSPGSGGFFMSFAHLQGDRGPFWKAKHYRLQQFTDGITHFAKWPKGTLKHEAAHMELQLRLGMKADPRYGGLGIPIGCPRWFNEGHASVFEYWDFDKTVEENLKLVPDRGRYAPVIRRLHGTEDWKDFDYVWTIDPKTWAHDMTSKQGFLNYAQAWSLCAYMMTGGKTGRRDFRSVFDLSKRVGVDRQTTYHGDRMRAWSAQFPEEVKSRLEEHWNTWVSKNVSRDEEVPDEDYFLRRMGYDPSVVDKLVKFSKDAAEENSKWVKKEVKRRRKSSKIEK